MINSDFTLTESNRLYSQMVEQKNVIIFLFQEMFSVFNFLSEKLPDYF